MKRYLLLKQILNDIIILISNVFNSIVFLFKQSIFFCLHPSSPGFVISIYSKVDYTGYQFPINWKSLYSRSSSTNSDFSLIKSMEIRYTPHRNRYQTSL